MQNTLEALPLYITDNIIVGMGEVPAIQTKEGIAWKLPGNKQTFDRNEAIAAAEQLDRLFRKNMHKYRRAIFR